ncbi:tripartite motif-containing protein 2-like [Anneissia japonica]|uniref:tripartite motif-containing protein 2-like n=1 Tax=Anneissia japonica TaxID=1529436 RepID=UPI001425AA88|nr:tripartite motif-containing protein 2-like [Anneissia japonica]
MEGSAEKAADVESIREDIGSSVDPQSSPTSDNEKTIKKEVKTAIKSQPYTAAETKIDARQKSVDIDEDVELSESSSQVTVVDVTELNSQLTSDADIYSEVFDESKTLNDVADNLGEKEEATIMSDISSDEEEGDEFDDGDINEILGNDDTEEPVEYESAICVDDVRQSELKTIARFYEREVEYDEEPLEIEPSAKQHTDEEYADDYHKIRHLMPVENIKTEDDGLYEKFNRLEDLQENDVEEDGDDDDDNYDDDDTDDEDDDDDDEDDDDDDSDDHDEKKDDDYEFDETENKVRDNRFVKIEETQEIRTVKEVEMIKDETQMVDKLKTEEGIIKTATVVHDHHAGSGDSQEKQFENQNYNLDSENKRSDTMNNNQPAEILNAKTENMQNFSTKDTVRKGTESRFKEREDIISMLDTTAKYTDNTTKGRWKQRQEEDEEIQKYDDNEQTIINDEDNYSDELDVSQGFVVLWHRSDGEEEGEDDNDEKHWLNSKPPRQLRSNPAMNTSKHVENLLYCSMCRNRMKQPKSLPCLHSFCRECLQQHVKKSDGRLICPQCRKDCPLSTDGVDGLLDSHFIHNLSEFVEQGGTAKDAVPNCDGCDRDANDRCLDCPCPLCPECSKMHKRMRGTKTHRIISLKEYNSLSDREKIMMQPTSCPYHPRCELEFFCTVCEVPICMKCAVCGHEDHKRMNLVDVYEKQAMEIDSLRNKLAERLKSFEEVAGRTRAVAETLEKEEKGVESQIVDHAERMHEAIDKRKEELIRELKMKSKSKKDILRRQVNNYGEVMHSLHDTYEKTGHLLVYGNRSDVVFAKKSALQRIIEQLDVPLKSQPEENSFIGFKSVTNENVKLKLGNVLTTPAVAFQSRLERASGSYPLIGTEQLFVVRSVGHDGMDVKQGGAPVVAELSRPGTKGVALVDSVDNGDGNYVISFHPDTPGRYRLDAKLFDESTRDSPMEFEVKSRWDVAMTYAQDMKQPHDVTKAWDDTYAIADYGNNRILIRDIAGKFYDQITFAGLDKPFCPISLATTPNNEIVCSDYNNHQIFVTRMDRSLRLRFGSNDLSRPLGVAAFESGKFAVGDGQTIKLFGNGGELLKTVGRRGQGDAEFSNPWFIATSSKNFMAVADEGNGRIQLLDAEGRFIRAFKVMPSGGQALNPRGVFMDESDNIFVSATTSVLMYSNDGKLICRVNGEDSKMKSPCGITMLKAAMGNSPVLLVADRSDQCIKGFRV